MRKKNRLVFGVGVNDADYIVHKHEMIDSKVKSVWLCPFYKKWKHMLGRCYDKKLKEKYKTYQDCTCDQRWLIFSNFKAWMEKQDWEGKRLDKDILFAGNKIYGPEFCVLVSEEVNNFLIDCEDRRGDLPIGVSRTKSGKRFIAQCSGTGPSRGYIGTFSTPEEAHMAWRIKKYQRAVYLASSQDDPRVAKALIDRYRLDITELPD